MSTSGGLIFRLRAQKAMGPRHVHLFFFSFLTESGGKGLVWRLIVKKKNTQGVRLARGWFSEITAVQHTCRIEPTVNILPVGGKCTHSTSELSPWCNGLISNLQTHIRVSGRRPCSPSTTYHAADRKLRSSEKYPPSLCIFLPTAWPL